MHLRGAQAELQAAEYAVTDAKEAARAVRNQGRAAAINGDTSEWLLTLAEAEICNLTIQRRRGDCARATAAVNAAAERETTARRERKQMELVLDRIRLETCTEAARAEQRNLDETFRMVRRTL